VIFGLNIVNVLNVLENMIDLASLFLPAGRGVKPGRSGMLRILLKSDVTFRKNFLIK